MKVLKVALLSLMLLIPFCSFASFNGQASLQYDFFFPQQSHLASGRIDCLWGNENGFSFGFMSTIGYGIEHYTTGGSNALVYGPSFSLGPEIQFAFAEMWMASLSARALADYALYPVILRGETDLDVRYRLTEKLIVGLGTGFLFPEKCAAVHIQCGVLL